MKMLGLEKSLVYFSTSLRGLESTATRIGNGRMLDLYEEDHELLDDVQIEIRQAIEMCTISTNILNGITDTFSSVISNNLNMTMRTLTIITLIMAIPTIIFSFYGMNVDGLPLTEWWWFPVLPALVGCVVAAFLLRSGRFLK
jgi:magnesium transporter